MRINSRIILPDIIAQYILNNLVDQYGWIYMEIIQLMYGLPLAFILAKNLLAERLGKHRHYQVKHTPGLWRHVQILISFTLVVDDFGIGYIGRGTQII